MNKKFNLQVRLGPIQGRRAQYGPVLPGQYLGPAQIEIRSPSPSVVRSPNRPASVVLAAGLQSAARCSLRSSSTPSTAGRSSAGRTARTAPELRRPPRAPLLRAALRLGLAASRLGEPLQRYCLLGPRGCGWAPPRRRWLPLSLCLVAYLAADWATASAAYSAEC
jgi:hypothetical protein